MPGKAMIEPIADANEKTAPGGLDNAHHEDGDSSDHGKQYQRFDAAAGQHPVEDLHHVDGRGQDQQVYAEAEQKQPTSARKQLRTTN